jgi:competence protein ComEA
MFQTSIFQERNLIMKQLLIAITLVFSLFSAHLSAETAPAGGEQPLAMANATVNINTADAKTLAKALNGVGEVKAEAIVAFREANGAFASAEDLGKVKGIGAVTLTSNKDIVVVQ